MKILRVLVALAIAGQVATAIALFSELPEQIPVHFDAGGKPDRWARPDAIEWFFIPGLLAVAGIVCGFLLPAWTVGMARRKSPWLNVPDRERFYALSEAARVAAMRPVAIGLAAIALELQVLIAFLLVGTFRVAAGSWDRLPPLGIYGLIGLLLVTATVLAIASSRAVKRALNESGAPTA
ncbi:MAG: DUF1648 domain-containing protein [bacterium]|nr:DUF1648 domain-containing protein [bacterium]